MLGACDVVTVLVQMQLCDEESSQCQNWVGRWVDIRQWVRLCFIALWNAWSWWESEEVQNLSQRFSRSTKWWKTYGNTKCWQEHSDGVNTISNRSHNVTKIAPRMSQQGLLMRSKLETLMLDSEKWRSIGNLLSDITHITRPPPLCAKHSVQ